MKSKLLKLQERAASLNITAVAQAAPIEWLSGSNTAAEEALEQSPHGSGGYGGSRLSLRSPETPRRAPVYERYRMEEVAAQYEQAQTIPPWRGSNDRPPALTLQEWAEGQVELTKREAEAARRLADKYSTKVPPKSLEGQPDPDMVLWQGGVAEFKWKHAEDKRTQELRYYQNKAARLESMTESDEADPALAEVPFRT